MREIIKDIEQLEVAGELIDKNTPTASRLALFLIDNLTELIMYRKCLYEFRYDESWGVIKPSKYPIKRKDKIKRFFKPKLNFLTQDIKTIDESNEIVIRVGHELRNEAYHSGILRELILNQVTRAYFQTLLEVFPSLWLGYYSYQQEDDVKNFLFKYGIDFVLIDQDILKEICNKILTGREFNEADLAKDLSDDSISRIQEVIDAIDDLSSQPGAMSGDEGLKWLQFRDEGIVEFGVVENDEEYRLKMEEIQRAFNEYNQNVTMKTLKRWMEKAEEILNKKDKGIILQRFWEIDEQFINIENLVIEAIIDYEREIP